jgi:hypothetical protein
MNFNNNIINQVTGEEAVIDSNANLQFPVSEIDRGSYIKFDGTGGISFPNFQGLDEWTISFWLRVDKFPVGYYTYYSPVGKKADVFEGISGKYNFAIFQYKDWTDQQYTSTNTTNWHLLHAGTNTVEAKWYHFFFVRKLSGECIVGMNNTVIKRYVYTDYPVLNTQPLVIGGKINSKVLNTIGSIDELRIYDVGIDDPQFLADLISAREELEVVTPIEPACPTVEDYTDIEIDNHIRQLILEKKKRMFVANSKTANSEWSKWWTNYLTPLKNKNYWE